MAFDSANCTLAVVDAEGATGGVYIPLSDFTSGGGTTNFAKAAPVTRTFMGQANPSVWDPAVAVSGSVTAEDDSDVEGVRTRRIALASPFLFRRMDQVSYIASMLTDGMDVTLGNDGTPVGATIRWTQGRAGLGADLRGTWHSDLTLGYRYNTDATVTILQAASLTTLTPNIAVDRDLPVFVVMNARGADATGQNKIGLLDASDAYQSANEFSLFTGVRRVTPDAGQTLGVGIAPPTDAPGYQAGTGGAPHGFTPTAPVDVWVMYNARRSQEAR